jgi:DNA-binding transcriptional ArsR family regulator
MGVKSTVTLTRAEAERRFVDNRLKAVAEEARGRIEKELADLGDSVVPWSLRSKGVTLQDAIDVHCSIVTSLADDSTRRAARHHLVGLDDKQLEDELETLNDEVNDGEGFENYLISSRPEEDD